MPHIQFKQYITPEHLPEHHGWIMSAAKILYKFSIF